MPRLRLTPLERAALNFIVAYEEATRPGAVRTRARLDEYHARIVLLVHAGAAKVGLLPGRPRKK